MAQNQQEIVGAEEKYPRYRWVVISLLWVSQEVSVLLIGGLGMLLPAMREDLGFGITQGGLLASVGRLSSVMLFIPISLLLVRFSPKWVYFSSLVCAAVAGFFCGRAPVFVFLAVAYGILGTATMIREIPEALLRLQWIPRKQFATIMGITMGMTAMGQSMGIMIIPFLIVALGNWRNLFSAYTLAVLLLAIIWMLFARERITPAYQGGIDSQVGRSPLRGVLKRKEFPMIGIAVFGNGLAYQCTMLFLPTYLFEERGMALTTIGLIVGLMPIGGVCANFSMGFVSDKLGLRRPTMWPAALLQPLLYFSLLTSVPVWALPVLTFATGFAAWAPFAAINSIPYELPDIKPSEVAVGRSLTSTISMLGMVLGAPAVGNLAEVVGSLRTALYFVCAFPLTMAIIGFLLPETGPKSRSKEKK